VYDATVHEAKAFYSASKRENDVTTFSNRGCHDKFCIYLALWMVKFLAIHLAFARDSFRRAGSNLRGKDGLLAKTKKERDEL
jgi:hypothetical protein